MFANTLRKCRVGSTMILFSATLAVAWLLAQDASSQSAVAQDKTQAANAITEITLERTPCFGACPTYKLRLRRDGTAAYEGIANVRRMGRYSAKDVGHFFERLARLAVAIDYQHFDSKYTMRVTDLPSTITSIVVDGKRKQVVNYGGAGPIELWGFEMAADAVIEKINWAKADGQSPPAQGDG
ncbi:MAG: hypothetical protein D6744_19060 [Planctomycetota bacterium]|nr:MAG: hypothetical protein D6744_19060 [Planctomycetota bacterium]